MPITLQKEKLKELFMDLHVLTRLRIVIFDEHFHEIFSFPEIPCRFCALIKSNREAARQCDASDQNAFRICRKTKKGYSYKCHAGLVETAAPVVSHGVILGYIMFGQITDNRNGPLLWEDVRARCAPYRIPEPELYAACRQLDCLSEAQIKAASKILEACAGYIRLSELVSLRADDIIELFKNYVHANLTARLTAGEIAAALHISRTRLYETVREYTGGGVGEYIAEARISLAKKLLAGSDLPVSQVAAECGVPDYNYFSKFFKARTGTSPGRFRKDGGAAGALDA